MGSQHWATQDSVGRIQSWRADSQKRSGGGGLQKSGPLREKPSGLTGERLLRGGRGERGIAKPTTFGTTKEGGIYTYRKGILY